MKEETLNKPLLCGSEGHLPENTLISEEVQEIISYRPHWIIRRGNTIFFLVLLFLLSLTFIIQYPDVVNAQARLVALNAPKILIANTEGKLEKLLVSNEQQVAAGQQLAWLQSTASHEEVLQLQAWINQIYARTRIGGLQVLNNMPLPALARLGELQPACQEFQAVLLETTQVLASGYYQKKKAALEKDLQYLSELRSNTIEQKSLMEQDRQLQEKEYNAYASLAKDKVIAPLELNQYKSRLLSKEQSMEQANAQITSSNLSSHNKRTELLDLQKFISDQEQKFHTSLLNLKSTIEKWMQQYIVTAPEGGKVFFISSLQEKQLLSGGQELFYVQGKQSQFYGELMAAQTGLGKIKPGQKVLIKAESYPDTEYGYLTGRVEYIAGLPTRRDSFLVRLQLPHGLTTNYGKEIFFKNNLSAKAEIITDNRKLFDRLLGQLKQVWER